MPTKKKAPAKEPAPEPKNLEPAPEEPKPLTKPAPIQQGGLRVRVPGS